MANVCIVEEPISRLDEHAEIPISFVVDRILTVSSSGLDGIHLREVPVETPWVKDYDAIPEQGPTSWAKRFDVSNWGLLAAYRDDARVGGAVLAFDTVGVEMLDDAPKTAVLWDIRVRPEFRGHGIGAALFGAAEAWCTKRDCRTLVVETQNVNVAACRFYPAMGCTLGSVNRGGYPELPEETQLLWFKDLGR